MISRFHKFIYIHVPKTAGNTITKALLPQSETTLIPAKSPSGIESGDNFWTIDPEFGEIKHWPLTQYEQALGESIVGYRVFSSVRNPWDRLCSAYFFFKQTGVMFHTKARKLGIDPDDFDPNEFRMMIESDISGIRESLRPQVNFLQSHGRIRVDLIRYEQLKEDFNRVLSALNLPDITLPTLNKSRRSHYRDILDLQSAVLISEFYKADIQAFKYSY